MANSRPKLVIGHFDICLIRILTGFHMIGHWGWEICQWSAIIPSVVFGDPSQDFEGKARRLITHFGGWLAFGLIVILHDIFMVTIDVKRTRTYLGCIGTQAAVNFVFMSLIALHLVLYQTQGGLFSDYLSDPFVRRNYPQYISFLISALLAGICSLCLFLLNILLTLALHSSVPMEQLWKVNTKDAIVGDVSPMTRVHNLSVLGNPREPENASKMGKRTESWTTTPLFRRVSPAETHIYALTRNLFAVVAIGVLIFRAITALQEAQNETSTRAISANCIGAASVHNLSILTSHLTNDDRWGTTLPDGVNLTISAVWNDASRGYEIYNTTNCAVVWSQLERLEPDSPERLLQLFDCLWIPDPRYNSWNPRTTQGHFSDSFAYHIDLRPEAAGVAIGNVYESQMPEIWFVNREEFRNMPEDNLTLWNVSEVREYVPPLKLLRGSGIVAEANLITRKFIQSSIIKDIIFNSKPDYRRLSLYPIVERSVTMLNSSGTSISTAVIRPALNPGTSRVSSTNVCDFVEEYRVGTVFDVLGSVGGLFALLQSAHLLLFGRPLFWGLTGAKVITPFGLLGGCGSRSFKRRLKEEYHSESAETGGDTIQIVKFLRDFVIEFGPADLDRVKTPDNEALRSPLTPANDSKDLGGTQIPLKHMNSDSIVSLSEEQSSRGRKSWGRSGSYA